MQNLKECARFAVKLPIARLLPLTARSEDDSSANTITMHHHGGSTMLRIITILLCWLVASLAVTSVYAQRTGNPEKDAELADKQAAKKGNVLKIADNAPDRYTVVKGDTLWGISSKYLLDPWRWPELWRGNRSQIKDPHWIYPGDVLVLDRKNGTLSLERSGASGSRDGKLSPTVRAEMLDKVIPVIPANVIEPYLARPVVMDAAMVDGKIQEGTLLRDAPQIVGGKEGRTLLGSGDVAYVSGLKGDKIEWNAYRPGKQLNDPVSGELLGTEAVYLGKVKVVRRGEPAEVMITKVKLELVKGDRLLPDERVAVSNFTLKSPSKTIDARVVSIYGSVATGGQHSIITINRGKRDGLETGNVLALFRSTLPLDFKPDGDGKSVVLQPEDDRYGLVTVFRVSDRLSYALVMNSSRELIIGDTLRNP